MAKLPWLPGFRFHPTDGELICFYLKRKVCGRSIRPDIISELDIYKFAPWDLPGTGIFVLMINYISSFCCFVSFLYYFSVLRLQFANMKVVVVDMLMQMVQESHAFRVEILNGIFTVHEIENMQMGLE